MYPIRPRRRLAPTRAANLAAGLGARALCALAVCALALTASPADAQSPRDHLLVDAAWLAEQSDIGDLVLLHIGNEEEYATEHLPGARYLSLSSIAAAENHDAGTGLSLQLPEPAALARTLEGLGITDDSRVVVYYADDWVTPATRVLFTLDWIGLGDRVSLLDGGMRAWKAAGGRTAAGDDAASRATSPPAGSLTPRPRPDAVVTADWVRDRLGDEDVTIIDARAPVHYDGIQPTYLHRKPVRKGHIPGAANLPHSDIVDGELRVKPASELRALFEAAGYEPGDTIVAYCHLGQFATAVVFAARTLGYDVKLYDGSFQEWGSLERLPVEGPGR